MSGTVVTTAAELRRIVGEAVVSALAIRDRQLRTDSDLLTPRSAAKSIHRRLATVLGAIREGNLVATVRPGAMRGVCAGRPRYLIRVEDLHKWANQA